MPYAFIQSIPLLLISASLAAGGIAAAQDGPRDPYFTPTGAKSTPFMPKVIIRNIREDQQGNLWFATFGGPIRYDGKEFTNFGEEIRIPDTRIFSLTPAKDGSMWFGSITGGASRFDGKTARKFTVAIPTPPAKEEEQHDVGGLPDDNVPWVFEDQDGHMWIATDGGVSRFDGNTLTTFTKNDGLPHNAVYAIEQDNNGVLWFGTQGGVCSWDGKSFSDLAPRAKRTFTNVRSLAIGRDGALWFGGQEGAFRFDGESLSSYTSEDGLLATFVGSMLVDKDGNLWFGHPGGFPDFTGGGATRFDGKEFTPFSRKDGMTLDTVYCLFQDSRDRIWFGSAGDGACYWDGIKFHDASAGTPGRR